MAEGGPAWTAELVPNMGAPGGMHVPPPGSRWGAERGHVLHSPGTGRGGT